jgi:hypothetical protein
VSDGVTELAPPMELLDLEHGNSITLSLDRYEQGVTTIHPKTITPRDVRIHMQQNGLTEVPAPGTPIYKQIPVLRVFGRRVDKPSPNRYWDISSLTLQADLMPRLVANAGYGLTVTITAQGHKPTKRYSVEQG